MEEPELEHEHEPEPELSLATSVLPQHAQARLAICLPAQLLEQTPS